MKKLSVLIIITCLYQAHFQAAEASSAEYTLNTKLFKNLRVQSFNQINFNTKKGFSDNKKVSHCVNQDRILIEKLNDNFLLVAVFDGHGQRKDYRTDKLIEENILRNNTFIKKTGLTSESGRSIYYLDAGGYIANKAKNEIPDLIKFELSNQNQDLSGIITKTFETFQENIINRFIDLKNGSEDQTLTEEETIEFELLNNGGSTATIALINLNTKLVTIGVAGDSPAFIINQTLLQQSVKTPESLLKKVWSYLTQAAIKIETIIDPEGFNPTAIAIAKTADHDLQNPKEQERLSQQNELNLEIYQGVYLTNGYASNRSYAVQTTRSLGDIPTHLNRDNTPSKLGIATPEIYQFTLTPEMGLLLASDGLIGEEKYKNYLGITELEFIEIMSQENELSKNFITLIASLTKKPQDDVSAIFVTFDPNLGIETFDDEDVD